MSRWFRSHVQRSRSSHSSQPTVLSAQYLLTPSLDQYQTWCRGCPQWVDDPYWFSGHIFKGQCQTTPQPTVLSDQYLLTPSLDQYQTWCRGWPKWVDDPYWFSGHIFKGQVKPLFLALFVVRSISFDPLILSIPNFVQGLRQISRWSLLIFRSHVDRSNHSSQPIVLSTLYI